MKIKNYEEKITKEEALKIFCKVFDKAKKATGFSFQIDFCFINVAKKNKIITIAGNKKALQNRLKENAGK